jgi:hypothetical protein
MVSLGWDGEHLRRYLGAILLQGINFYFLPQVNEWVQPSARL